MLQGCLVITDLGAAGILQASSTQVSFQNILSVIEQVKEVVPRSDHSLLCEDTQMISFTQHRLAGTGPEHLVRKRMRAEFRKLGEDAALGRGTIKWC